MTPPILTADDAVEIHDEFPWPQIKAIATGRTVVVEVMTEAQAREAFYEFLDSQPGGVPDRLEFFLAALRHAGVLKS